MFNLVSLSHQVSLIKRIANKDFYKTYFSSFLPLSFIIFSWSQSSKRSVSDPSAFVRLELGNHEEKTQVKQKTTNPRWEQSFRFFVADPELQDLLVEVIDLGIFLWICDHSLILLTLLVIFSMQWLEIKFMSPEKSKLQKCILCRDQKGCFMKILAATDGIKILIKQEGHLVWNHNL